MQDAVFPDWSEKKKNSNNNNNDNKKMYIFFDALNRWLRTYGVKRFKREKQGS